MKRKINKKEYRIFALDLETHADPESVSLRKTGMWLGVLIDENSKEEDEECYSYTADQILGKLERLSFEGPIIVYIFNLSFEWSFLLPVLLDRFSFKWKPEIKDEDSYCFNSVTNKTCASVWEATIKFAKYENPIVFRDLRKMFPTSGSLRTMAKSFNLPTQKGEIDYTIDRRNGWKVTKEEKHYCFCDTKIIMDVLSLMNNDEHSDFWSSISMASFAFKQMLRSAYPDKKKPFSAFRSHYPRLSKEENAFLRHAVSGGICYATPRWQFVEINSTIKHLDVHSMHPSQEVRHYFPYGRGTYFKGNWTDGSLCIRCLHCLISYDSVILHSVIQLIGIDCVTDYEIYLWDFEIPTMRKCYKNLKIEVIDGYAYKAAKLPWAEWIKETFKQKEEAGKQGDMFKRGLCKNQINSCYGKFLERPHEIQFENFIDEDGLIDSVEHPAKLEDDNARFTYLGVGGCIPAYSRVRLIEDALTLSPDGRYIVYFDTDSIFFLDNETTRENSKKLDIGDGLGQWGWEPDIIKGQFVAPKRYKDEYLTKMGTVSREIKAGGITIPKTMTYDEANLIDGSFQAQTAVRAAGGTVIAPVDKKMSVQEKYQAIYQKNSGLEVIEDGKTG